MATINFITKKGEKITVEGQSGSVMELAVDNNIDGIIGACGGVCSCATCHVHVAPEFMEAVGKADDMEESLLEFDDNMSEFSRLSCQMNVANVPDGLVLTVATSE